MPLTVPKSLGSVPERQGTNVVLGRFIVLEFRVVKKAFDA